MLTINIVIIPITYLITYNTIVTLPTKDSQIKKKKIDIHYELH